MIGIEAEVESEKYNISGNALKLTIRDSRSLKEIAGNEIPPIEFHFKTFSQLRECRNGEIAGDSSETIIVFILIDCTLMKLFSR